jgi:hypothetical protein
MTLRTLATSLCGATESRANHFKTHVFSGSFGSEGSAGARHISTARSGKNFRILRASSHLGCVYYTRSSGAPTWRATKRAQYRGLAATCGRIANVKERRWSAPCYGRRVPVPNETKGSDYMRLKSGGVLLGLVAALAMSVASAPAALAVGPTIVNGKGQAPQLTTITSKSGSMRINFGSSVITCSKSSGTGEWTGTTKVKADVITFTGCRSGKGTCQAALNSQGAHSEEIKTAALKGELGAVANAEAASEVGLLTEVESGTKWFTLAANECTPEFFVTGALACEVTPREKLQTTDKLECLTQSGFQKIRKLTRSGTGELVKPRLEGFAHELSFVASSENVFGEPLKVVL